MTTSSLRSITLKFIRFVLVGLVLGAWGALPRSSYSAPTATTWYVAPGGSNSNACTSEQPCDHIQTAINLAASGDTINIAAGTYIEQLSIVDKTLTLKGEGAASTLLDGNQSFSILSIIASNVQNLTVNISGVTLQNGNHGSQAGAALAIEARCSVTVSDSVIASNTTNSSGGGISNQGTLKLINVTVRANHAIGPSSEGGGIYNTGSLELNSVLLIDNDAPSGGGISNRNTVTVTSSSIISNTSNGSGGGGGIYNPAGSLILLNSIFSGNAASIASGGAIYNNGNLISTRTIIQGNSTVNSGGGIYNFTASKTILADDVIQNNTSTFEGGGLFNSGTAQIDRTSITSNRADNSGGGGIHNTASGKLTIGSTTIVTNTAAASTGGGINNAGALTLTQSALVYNGASTAGGLNNTGTTTMTNVTVSDNTASSGSGIYNSGALSMQFSTISRNKIQASGNLTASNSILDNACATSIASADYNIDTGISCGFSGPHDLSTTNAQLGPLQDNGGGTLTRAIDYSSAAVDSANDGACPPTDQRGVVRPQGDHCDRGAYEVVGYSKSSPLDIGFGVCVTSTLHIADKYAVGRMLAGVNLTYTNRSDLKIRLLSPTTPRVILLGPAAPSGQNLDTLFDDNALSGTIVPGGYQNPASPYYENVYKPTTPLAQLRGIRIQGDWKLEICSAAVGEHGTLNRWVLVVPEFYDALKVYLPLVRR